MPEVGRAILAPNDSMCRANELRRPAGSHPDQPSGDSVSEKMPMPRSERAQLPDSIRRYCSGAFGFANPDGWELPRCARPKSVPFCSMAADEYSVSRSNRRRSFFNEFAVKRSGRSLTTPSRPCHTEDSPHLWGRVLHGRDKQRLSSLLSIH